MWKEFFADKTDPQGRASINRLKQFWGLVLGTILSLIFMGLVGLGKMPKDLAWPCVALIAIIFGYKEVNAIVQKLADSKVKGIFAAMSAAPSTTTAMAAPNPTPHPAAQPPSTAPAADATTKAATATGDSTKTGGGQ